MALRCGFWEVDFLQKNSVRLLVDYFCFTVSRLDFFSADANEQFIFDRIRKKMYLDGLAYAEKRSFYGYAVTYNAQGITICFGGRDDIYIQMSGTGCRAWETLNPGMTWEQYIAYLFQTYCSLHFSRLDIACDTFNLLEISKIQRYTRAQKFVSKWRTYLILEGNKENSVIFGSSASDFRCRIYDKTLERIQAGREEVPKSWVRVEFQLRNKSAASFIESWRRLGDLSTTFLGMLRNQLLFYRSYDGSHTDRMELTPWWERLLGNAGKIKMAYSGGMEYNLDSLKNYVVRQAGSSVRTYLEAVGPDKLLEDVLARPLNDRQRALLATATQERMPWDRE